MHLNQGIQGGRDFSHIPAEPGHRVVDAPVCRNPSGVDLKGVADIQGAWQVEVLCHQQHIGGVEYFARPVAGIIGAPPGIVQDDGFVWNAE